jgi:hypothetical protein
MRCDASFYAGLCNADSRFSFANNGFAQARIAMMSFVDTGADSMFSSSDTCCAVLLMERNSPVIAERNTLAAR